MLEFFNLQNWSDLVNEDGFGTLVFILSVAAVALPALLFSDRLQGWRDNRRERAKFNSFRKQSIGT